MLLHVPLSSCKAMSMIVALRFKIGAPRRSMRCRLCIGKCFPVVKGNLQLGVLAVEIVFKSI